MVAVTTGGHFMLKEATKAKTELILIIAGEGSFREIIKAAANQSLVDVEENQSENQFENEPSCVRCCNRM